MSKKCNNSALRNLLKDADAYLILFMSYVYAVMLLLMPNVYDLDYIDIGTRLFFPRTTAILLIITASIKVVGRLLCNIRLRYIGLIMLNAIWFYVMISLIWRLAHGMPSLGFLLGLHMFLSGIVQAMREDYGDI